IPSRSASRSRTPSNSAGANSPSLRSSFTLATVAIRCTSKAPLSSRNAFGMATSQWLPRRDVVWATMVKTSSSSPLGWRVRTRQGRTFAAMPRSTCQTSPGFAAGILGLLFVHILKHRIGGLVEKERFVLLFQPAQQLADGGPLVRRQLGQLLHDFCSTHGGNLPLLGDAGKSCSVTPGEHYAGNQHLVADFQRPDFFFGKWEG